MTDYGRLHATARFSSSLGPRARLLATVIGELQRTFCGARLFGSDFPPFVHHGRLLGSARRGRAIRQDNETNDLIVSVSGGISKGGRNRLRGRADAAKSAQALQAGPRRGQDAPGGSCSLQRSAVSSRSTPCLPTVGHRSIPVRVCAALPGNWWRSARRSVRIGGA
ncbi:hypothetical protein [Streptomyces scabiei]|uniref:hypothetical protein n=1 Tax=Streptomyces scabiei TaxID=1930 RepID=UPI00131DABE7|nr:hypothetical protein [Streptomyces scabiei]